MPPQDPPTSEVPPGITAPPWGGCPKRRLSEPSAAPGSAARDPLPLRTLAGCLAGTAHLRPGAESFPQPQPPCTQPRGAGPPPPLHLGHLASLRPEPPPARICSPWRAGAQAGASAVDGVGRPGGQGRQRCWGKWGLWGGGAWIGPTVSLGRRWRLSWGCLTQILSGSTKLEEREKLGASDQLCPSS